MYGMLRYFMGFADEHLEPACVYGGKRFRSALALLVGDMYGMLDRVIPAALSIELFHNFTLIHDDIVDNDTMRRGRPTVWKLWGIPHAINSGDAQLVLAYRALERLYEDDPMRAARVQAFLSACYLEVAEGQYLDFILTDMPLSDARVTRESYFEMIRKKTSVLVGAATKVAGLMAECPDAECAALYEYGVHLGMAVQLHDDLMSIWGDPQRTGKVAFGDLRERKKTLPIIFGLAQGGEVREMLLSRYVSDASMTDAEAAELAAALEAAGARKDLETEIARHQDAMRVAVGRLSLSASAQETLAALHIECMPR